MAGDCGTCTMCCKVYPISEVGKVGGHSWCRHAKPGRGCGIYDTRPARCSDFACLWLLGATVEGAARPPAELRPDRCGVVFAQTTNPRVMSAICDPGRPHAWKARPVMDFIEKLVTKRAMRVVVSPDTSRKKILFAPGPLGEVTRKTLLMSEPDAEGMMWSHDSGASDWAVRAKS